MWTCTHVHTAHWVWCHVFRVASGWWTGHTGVWWWLHVRKRWNVALVTPPCPHGHWAALKLILPVFHESLHPKASLFFPWISPRSVIITVTPATYWRPSWCCHGDALPSLWGGRIGVKGIFISHRPHLIKNSGIANKGGGGKRERRVWGWGVRRRRFNFHTPPAPEGLFHPRERYKARGSDGCRRGCNSTHILAKTQEGDDKSSGLI